MGLYVKIIEVSNEVLYPHLLKSPRPNVVGTFSTGNPGPTHILNDHQDVVPPCPDWAVDPLSRVTARSYVKTFYISFLFVLPIHPSVV